MAFTDNLIELALLPEKALPQTARDLARLSLIDWIVCGRAGINEPLASKLCDLASSEAGSPDASIFGGMKAPARMAALVNGATAHALDFDDTHFGHIGHLSVGIYPAALAVGEALDKRAAKVIDAFLVGAEAAVRIGKVLGTPHYNLGFHQTATAGAFGAALAAGRLLQLEPAQMRVAIGLCSTRASGLKSQFGTMGKPLNAGIAAANGVEAAQLASLGFTSADDGLMGPQGFVETHSPEAAPEAGWENPPPDTFVFEENKYKFHACCHGLHAMIEGLLAITAERDVSLEDIESFDLRTNPRWLRVCDIKRPRTGLEVKFSYNWLAGMTLRGDRTGDDRLYSDALAADPDLAAFAQKVSVTGDAGRTDMQAEGALVLSDGSTLRLSHDLAAPLGADVLSAKLREKASALLGEAGAEIWEALAEVGQMSARQVGAQLGVQRPAALRMSQA